MKADDLTGRKFGLLTVIARDGATSAGKAKWRCACECGQSTSVIAANLKNGMTRSCGNHGSELAPALTGSDLYRIVAIDGPKLGMQPTQYGFCEVYDIERGELLFRNEPVSRIETVGEPSANAARGMVWLTQQGLIEPKRNQTWRQWLIATRCVAEIRQIADAEAVVSAWENAAGTQLNPHPAGARPSFAPVLPEIPDITPAQRMALDAFLSDEDDGADHMERYPISAEAKAEMDLQEARRGGQAELLAARLRASKARLD